MKFVFKKIVIVSLLISYFFTVNVAYSFGDYSNNDLESINLIVGDEALFEERLDAIIETMPQKERLNFFKNLVSLNLSGEQRELLEIKIEDIEEAPEEQRRIMPEIEKTKEAMTWKIIQAISELPADINPQLIAEFIQEEIKRATESANAKTLKEYTKKDKQNIKDMENIALLTQKNEELAAFITLLRSFHLVYTAYFPTLSQSSQEKNQNPLITSFDGELAKTNTQLSDWLIKNFIPDREASKDLKAVLKSISKRKGLLKVLAGFTKIELSALFHKLLIITQDEISRNNDMAYTLLQILAENSHLMPPFAPKLNEIIDIITPELESNIKESFDLDIFRIQNKHDLEHNIVTQEQPEPPTNINNNRKAKTTPLPGKVTSIKQQIQILGRAGRGGLPNNINQRIKSQRIKRGLTNITRSPDRVSRYYILNPSETNEIYRKKYKNIIIPEPDKTKLIILKAFLTRQGFEEIIIDKIKHGTNSKYDKTFKNIKFLDRQGESLFQLIKNINIFKNELSTLLLSNTSRDSKIMNALYIQSLKNMDQFCEDGRNGVSILSMYLDKLNLKIETAEKASEITTDTISDPLVLYYIIHKFIHLDAYYCKTTKLFDIDLALDRKNEEEKAQKAQKALILSKISSHKEIKKYNFIMTDIDNYSKKEVEDEKIKKEIDRIIEDIILDIQMSFSAISYNNQDKYWRRLKTLLSSSSNDILEYFITKMNESFMKQDDNIKDAIVEVSERYNSILKPLLINYALNGDLTKEETHGWGERYLKNNEFLYKFVGLSWLARLSIAEYILIFHDTIHPNAPSDLHPILKQPPRWMEHRFEYASCLHDLTTLKLFRDKLWLTTPANYTRSLCVAAAMGNLRLVKILVNEYKVNPDSGMNMHAVKENILCRSYEFILNYYLSSEEKDKLISRNVPYIKAIDIANDQGCLDIVEFLLKKGASLSSESSTSSAATLLQNNRKKTKFSWNELEQLAKTNPDQYRSTLIEIEKFILTQIIKRKNNEPVDTTPLRLDQLDSDLKNIFLNTQEDKVIATRIIFDTKGYILQKVYYSKGAVTLEKREKINQKRPLLYKKILHGSVPIFDFLKLSAKDKIILETEKLKKKATGKLKKLAIGFKKLLFAQQPESISQKLYKVSIGIIHPYILTLWGIASEIKCLKNRKEAISKLYSIQDKLTPMLTAN